MHNPLPLIHLSDLFQTPIEALTAAVGENLAEAAAFCLVASGFHQGIHLTVAGFKPLTYQLTWSELPENVAAARNDLKEATEEGASGIAVLLARVHLGYEVFLRSRQGTGFDYLMREIGSDVDAPPARLEVSGIMKGNRSDIQRRMAEKTSQVKEHESPQDQRPAFVIVVEFSYPQARIESI